MSEAKEARGQDWHDARTHREPKWPVGGFAPGNYQIRCGRCERIVMGADKRAVRCFPCAVDDLQEGFADLSAKLAMAQTENGALRNSIRIIREPRP